MSIKPSNIFGSENLNVKETKLNYVPEEKDPNEMFIEPVYMCQCPLCGGNVYSENDPSEDPSMSRRCCKCTWNDNQFLTWEEMNNVTEEFEPTEDVEVCSHLKKFYQDGIEPSEELKN